MNAQTDRARGLFACLGDVSRYRIVATLTSGERCVTELAREVGLSQSCTTRHLQTLQRVGLVSGERQGKRVVYRLRSDDPRFEGLLEWIRLDSLGGDGEARETRPAMVTRRREAPSGARTARPVRQAVVRPPAPTPPPEPATDAPVVPAPRRPVRSSQDMEDFLL